VELEGAELAPFPDLKTSLYNAVGVNSSTDAYKVGKELLQEAGKAMAQVALLAAPLEEVVLGGLGFVAKELGLGLKVESSIIKTETALIKAENTVSKGEDFIVSEKGTAVPTSQSRMKEGFEKAGFPSSNTNSPGKEYTLPDGRKTRTMEASGQAPKRASFENKNGQPVDADGRTVNPP
jgi:hypothetical protein